MFGIGGCHSCRQQAIRCLVDLGDQGAVKLALNACLPVVGCGHFAGFRGDGRSKIPKLDQLVVVQGSCHLRVVSSLPMIGFVFHFSLPGLAPGRSMPVLELEVGMTIHAR